MAGIPKRFIRDIIDMTDIISLVEKYVPLTKKGKDHWGLCPFCEDGKNPSFSVSQQKQFYYCFKCRSTGNVIGFLEQYSGLNFVESIETLASLNSIEVPYEDSPKRAEGREDIYDALDKATIFYESYLSNEASAEKVRKYLNEKRKLSGSVCRHFSIGYAPSSWDALTDHLVQKGIKEEVLINAGLSKRNKKGDLYDIFRDRLMFPIKDRKGRTVGFGGRVMNPEDQPKYLNTGETLVFQKGKELYGLYESSLNRRDITKIFVVEGYVDVVAMFDKGMENSVATLGIATNRFHVQKLLQIVDEIVFCFDGDDAGRGAAWGALKNALPAINDGAELKFLFLPDGEDPASLLETETKQEFEQRAQSSLMLSEYFVQRLSNAVGTGSLEKKAKLATQATALLKTMPESSIKLLLQSEVSKVTGLSQDDIAKFGQSEATPKRVSPPVAQEQRDTKEDKLFESNSYGAKALSVLISYPKLSGKLEELDWLTELKQPELKLLLEVGSYFHNNEKGSVADLLSSLDKESASFIGSLMSSNPVISKENSENFFNDCLEAMKKQNPNLRISELRKVFKNNDLSEDETFELQQHLLSKIDSLTDDDKELLKELSKA